MMRVLLATTAAAVAAVSISSALAADLRRPAPVVKAPPPVVAVFNWTGCYIGGHVGGAWGDKSWTFVPSGLDAGSHDVDGWLGGGQVGCDLQFGNWVIGAEGSYSWADINGSHAGNAINPSNFVSNSDVESIGTATGRLGFASNNWLFYAKGGGAWVRDHFSVTVNGAPSQCCDERQTRSGWLVGGGIEYAFAPSWSAKVEYNFIDLGNKTAFAGTTAPTDISQEIHTLKFGLNFRFGGFGGY
jgi:outer membrane immunogenic protein